MDFGAREDRTQEARQPRGEGSCFFLGADEILTGLDEEAGKSAACDGLVQRIAPERAIIGFVVADTEPLKGQCRDQGSGETRIVVPIKSRLPTVLAALSTTA